MRWLSIGSPFKTGHFGNLFCGARGQILSYQKMRYLAAHAQIHKYNTHIWAACALAINNLPEWELSRASTLVQRATAGEVGGALGGALQLQQATAGLGALQWGQEDWGPGRWQSGRHGFHTFHMHRPPSLSSFFFHGSQSTPSSCALLNLLDKSYICCPQKGMQKKYFCVQIPPRSLK